MREMENKFILFGKLQGNRKLALNVTVDECRFKMYVVRKINAIYSH
jgi:hypothetical protein